jgi:phospholipid N-methyltransferase
MLSTIKVFYQNVYTHVQTTGSIAPSSKHLTDAMIRMIQHDGTPLTILEAGPGTGPFTLPLIRMMEEGDLLDLCELNPNFVAHLQNLFQAEPAYQTHQDRIHLYNIPVQELEGEKKYDYIVSSLPFNNFPPDLVEEILTSYRRMIKPGGLLSFFEYAYVRPMKKLIVGSRERARINAVGDVIQAFVDHYSIQKTVVALNLPPARVYICQL